MDSSVTVVPDPVAVAPPVVVIGARLSDEVRARRLVMEGRALVDDPNDVDAAVGRFLEAIALDSLNGDAYWELGWAYQRLVEWREVVVVLRAGGEIVDKHLMLRLELEFRRNHAGEPSLFLLLEQ